MKNSAAALVFTTIVLAAGAARADVALGSYDFASNEFGNTLVESDGGAYSAANWLNVNNVDPGNPGYLTGANFDTGIANIGLSQTTVTYTIGYNTVITNGGGADLGVVTARFSTGDSVELSVSTDGVNFSAPVTYGPGAGADSGVGNTYYYAGFGPYPAELFVTSVDLNDFGLANGATVKAIRVTGSPELDLIRVAGFATAVPEPGSVALMLAGLGLMGGVARRRASR